MSAVAVGRVLENPPTRDSVVLERYDISLGSLSVCVCVWVLVGFSGMPRGFEIWPVNIGVILIRHASWQLAGSRVLKRSARRQLCPRGSSHLRCFFYVYMCICTNPCTARLCVVCIIYAQPNDPPFLCHLYHLWPHINCMSQCVMLHLQAKQVSVTSVRSMSHLQVQNKCLLLIKFYSISLSNLFENQLGKK